MITMKKIAITLFFCASCFVLLFAQKEPAWDNTCLLYTSDAADE